MINYKCARCGYETNLKSNYRTHLGRKQVCEPLYLDVSIETLLDQLELKTTKGEYKCDYCDKIFKSAQSKYQHKFHCKYKDNKLLTNQILDDKDTKIIQLEQELEKLRSEKIQNINIQNNFINVNLRSFGNASMFSQPKLRKFTFIKLRSFGCENMEALPKDFISSMFLFLKFRDLLENLHCDNNFPENNNIRIKSTKRKIIEIYRGNDKWDIVSFVNGLDELLLQGHRIFTEFYKKNKQKILEEDMDEDDLREILDKLSRIERLNEEDIKPLRLDLQLILESNRNNKQLV